MRQTAKVILLFLLASMCSMAAEASYTGAEDKRAVMAAQKAAERLGKERGALSIKSKSLDIIGLERSVSGRSTGIKKTLRELNAKRVGMDIQISLSGDVLFDFDKWKIKPEAKNTLKKITKVIRELKKSKVVIEGHTDAKGSDAYNQRLSQKRADAIKYWFLGNGDFTSVVFVTKGYGEFRPVAPNTKPSGVDNPSGRAKNRRVEITIK